MRALKAWAIGGLGALALGAVGAVTAAPPAASGPSALTAGYNGSGQRLFQAFAKTPGNIVFSPYSIGTAMAMALAGARGENEAEMAKVLGLALPRQEVDAANAVLLASLNKMSSASFQLRIANALMLTRKGGVISEDYVALLHEKYAAEVFRGADLATVNGWVKNKTAGKIDSILDRLDPMTALVLLDAVYFKARWQQPFAVKATHDEPFHLLNGAIQVPMMHVHDRFAVAETSGYRAISLPYAGAHVSMVVVLPDGNVADLVQRFDGNEMQSLLTALRVPAQPVDLALPRFHANFKASLIEPFVAMGMHRPFDKALADFSGMTGKLQSAVPLQIDQIVHRAVIDVAEEGTEAAAVTGVAISVASAMPRPDTIFRVDRPFLFAIVDDETGVILFEGRIVDPR